MVDHKPVQFNGPRKPTRGIISDGTAEVIVALGILAIGLPIWLANRTWTFLRTGKFPYP